MAMTSASVSNWDWEWEKWRHRLKLIQRNTLTFFFRRPLRWTQIWSSLIYVLFKMILNKTTPQKHIIIIIMVEASSFNYSHLTERWIRQKSKSGYSYSYVLQLTVFFHSLAHRSRAMIFPIFSSCLLLATSRVRASTIKIKWVKLMKIYTHMGRRKRKRSFVNRNHMRWAVIRGWNRCRKSCRLVPKQHDDF